MRVHVHTKKQSGYSLIELLVYVALFAVVLIIFVQGAIELLNTYAQYSANRIVRNTSLELFERVGHELRDAQTINVSSSVFTTHPGTLAYITNEDEMNMNSSIILDNGSLLLYEESNLVGPLTPEEIEVSDFVLYHLNNTSSEMVVIEVTLSTTKRNVTVEKSYRDAFVLRGSYGT